MPGCPGQSQFMLLVLVYLSLLPHFTLNGVLVWMINCLVSPPTKHITAHKKFSPAYDETESTSLADDQMK